MLRIVWTFTSCCSKEGSWWFLRSGTIVDQHLRGYSRAESTRLQRSSTVTLRAVTLNLFVKDLAVLLQPATRSVNGGHLCPHYVPKPRRMIGLQ